MAVWQHTPAQWARDCLTIFALYVGLAGLIALRRWKLGRDLLWLVAFGPVHMLAARRPATLGAARTGCAGSASPAAR